MSNEIEAEIDNTRYYVVVLKDEEREKLADLIVKKLLAAVSAKPII